MKNWFYIVSGVLLFLQFFVYAIMVRPYIGSVLGPHSVRRGFFDLSYEVMLQIAVVSLSVAIFIYLAVFLMGIFWEETEVSKDKTLEWLAIANIAIAFGQLIIVFS